MLYYNFNGYEEFCYRFGIIEHGNGKTSRRNKILLDFIKDRKLLRNAIRTNDFSLLNISNMADLKKMMFGRIMDSGEDDNLPYEVRLINYTFHSGKYETDKYNGICTDLDARSCRYINHGNGGIVFKMKAGKFIRRLILETSFGRTLPESVIIYLQECFVQDWQAFSISSLPKENRLFVDDNFGGIYDSGECEGDFYSCMTDKGYHTFYRDSVDASAAYLRNNEGKIITRCIIFNKVYEEGTGKIWRLAERQYSTNQDDKLKRALVNALIIGGYIDGYKQVGYDCHHSRAFVDIYGNSLEDRRFYIDCSLETDDTLSYQDSFKWYDMSEGRAYNYEASGYDYELDTTDGSIDGYEENDDESYDEFHECYGDFDTTIVMYHGREYSCSVDDLGEFVWIDSEEMYYHESDVDRCPWCGEWFVKDDGHESELTGNCYCSEECREKAEDCFISENWHRCDWDGEYYEHEEDLITYKALNILSNTYTDRTIPKALIPEAVNNNELYLVDGVYYDALDENGEPYKPKSRTMLTAA